MAIPSVNMLSNMVGGAIPNVMNAHNEFTNNAHLRKINAIKELYAPITSQAEAASKLAYANLMGPQFLAKLLQNPGAIANMGDEAAREALLKSVRSGMGGGSGQNYLNNISPPQGNGQPSTNNFLGQLKNTFMGMIGQPSQQGNNPFAQGIPQQQYPGGAPMNGSTMNQSPGIRPKNGVTVEGSQWYDENGTPVYEEDVQTPNENIRIQEIKPTWGEKTGQLKGEEKQGEEAGKYRAEALKNIGQSQLALSNSGAVLKKLTSIVKNPLMQNMREKIPLFQDKQLSVLKALGTPEEKKLIGQFLSTAESFIASTVQGFSGKPLVREFDLAQRQKITPSDNMQVAEGKLQSAIDLHDIAEKKNEIISNLLKRGVDESDAVKQANKMVDVSAIEKRTEELLADKITDDDIDTTAKQNRMTREEVIRRLKSEGRYHG